MSLKLRSRIASVSTVALLLTGWTGTKAQEPEGRTVPVNGVELYLEELGQGPPLLLLHEFGGCGDSWRPHVAELARNYRLIVPDLPGHGHSSNRVGGAWHRQAAHDVFALLDSLGVRRVRAIGMSSGGMTLLHMATSRPERIEAMVLVGATPFFPESAREFMRRSVPENLSAEEMAEWSACSARGDAQTREVLAMFRDLEDDYEDMNFTAPYLATIQARTLIVHGDRDELFPIEIPVEMYRAIPDAALWIVPDGGHIPIHGEWARAFREEVLRFLAAEHR